MSTPSLDGGTVEHREVQTLQVEKSGGRLSNRILAVAALSVALTVAVALAVAFPLVRSQAQSQAREELSRQADTVVSILLDGATGRPIPGIGGRDRDRANGATGDVRAAVYIVDVAATATSPIAQGDIAAVISGQDLSIVRDVDGLTYFIEGRSLTLGVGVILVQRDIVAAGSTNVLLGRMALALAAGLGLALLLASVVARRTAAPLREAAAAAGRMAQGARDVELNVRGPQEISDLAQALNQLATALAVSEDRQRDFLMSVSHELRTPMTSIKGYAEALADEVVSGSEVPAAGQVLVSEAQRLERLISDLLDLARSGAVDFPLELATSDAAEVAHSAAEVWRLRCSKENIQFELDVAESAPLFADAARLRQLIDNLVENAVRVVPAGGRIRLSVALQDSQVSIAVDDDGPGLSEADLKVAFDPGVLHSRYRKERPVGTGLGLALVGRLARRMGGEAVAGHSELGGARFALHFPSHSANS